MREDKAREEWREQPIKQISGEDKDRLRDCIREVRQHQKEQSDNMWRMKEKQRQADRYNKRANRHAESDRKLAEERTRAYEKRKRAGYENVCRDWVGWGNCARCENKRGDVVDAGVCNKQQQ